MATKSIIGVLRVSNMGGRMVSADSTLTLEDQTAALHQTAATAGHRIGKIVHAVDESGFTFAAGDTMAEVLASIKAGDHAGVAFAYFDRNGRNWWEQGPFFKQLEDADAVYLVRGMEAIDYRSQMGRQIFGGMAVASESSYFAAKDRSDRVVAKMLDGFVPNRVPYGYHRNGTFVDGKCVHKVDDTRNAKALAKDDTAAVVRRIFALTLTKHSTKAIAAILNGEGIPGPRGGEWVHSTVANIVANEIYKGVFTYGKLTGKRKDRRHVEPSKWRRFEDPTIAIVTATEWKSAQATKQAPVKRTGTHKAGVAGGLVMCSGCGKPMRVVQASAYKGVKRFNYGCGRHSTAGACPAPTNVKKDAADTFVDAIVAEALDGGTIDTVAATRAADTARKALEAAKDERSALTTKVKPSHPNFEAWLADADADVAMAEAALDDASAHAGVTSELPTSAAYLALDVPRRNAIARALLAGVVVNPPASRSRLEVVAKRFAPAWR